MLVGLMLVLLATSLLPQQRRIVEYRYDAAGNTTGITTSVVEGPPAVSQLSPGLARRDATIAMTATGDNLSLALALVSTDTPGLSIGDVETTNTSVSFTVTGASDTPLGPATLTFTTGGGSTSRNISVAPTLPRLVLSDTPLVARAGAPLPLRVALSHDDVLDHVVTATIGNSAVASIRHHCRPGPSPTLVRWPLASCAARRCQGLAQPAVLLGRTS